MDHPPSFGFDERAYAVIVAGRRITQDALEAAGATQRGIAELAALVRAEGVRLGLPLAYVHMGTTVNWSEDRADRIPKEGADAIVGVVLALAAYDEGPVALQRAELDARAADRIPESFWAELSTRAGVSPEPSRLVLAPAGWAIAELYDGAAIYDPRGQVFDQKPLLQTSSEDFPPGAPIDLDALPERIWLRPFYG